MFDVITFNDIIRINPRNFDKDTVSCITTEINDTLANKVLLNTGLGVALWDILNYGDCEIYPSDGAFHIKVTFRYVIFKPILNEVIIGVIKCCTPEGLQITLDFFDDIIIPPQNLPSPSYYANNRWLWKYTAEGQENDIYLDKKDTIIFKVVDFSWKDSSPISSSICNDNRTQLDQSMAPLTIIGTITGQGLGLPCWWEQ